MKRKSVYLALLCAMLSVTACAGGSAGNETETASAETVSETTTTTDETEESTSVEEESTEVESEEETTEEAVAVDEMRDFPDETHIIYDDDTIESRISEIEDYFDNQMEDLTMIPFTYEDWEGLTEYAFYFNGDDLLFAYGIAEDAEYRLYFYEAQLIRLRIDKAGEESVQLDQAYKELATIWYDQDVNDYLELESLGRKIRDRVVPATDIALMNEAGSHFYRVTDVTDNVVTFHVSYHSGSDGAMSYIGQNAYQATISDELTLSSYSDSPLEEVILEDASVELAMYSQSGVGLICELEFDGDTITAVTLPYFA